MTPLALSPVEQAGLAAYLTRVVALDDRAAVRVQARGAVAGVWSGPPFGVLALRPVALLEPADVDATVSARRLLERLNRGDGRARSDVSLPDGVVGPAWAALLPPQASWERVAEVPVTIVTDQVGVMLDGFRRRADQLPASERTPAVLTAIAEQLWAGPSVAGAPMRAAHAAAALQMLGREGTVTTWRAHPWVRLACPGGSVLARADSGDRADLGTVDVLGAFGPRL